VRRASAAGAQAVIIDIIVPGDPRTFSSLTCPEPPDGTCKPAIVIQQSLASSIRTALASGPVNATISPNNGVAAVGSVRSSSSRGPSYDYNQIKPDIAAPGASVSAEVGRGTGETPFGGTSGAAPMVAGAAALLIQAYPNRPPWAIKSLLMNTADTTVFTNALDRPGELAPITRIGGGEVRVDQALASTTAAWDLQRRTGSLSFGYLNVSEPTTLVRHVRVENYSGSTRTYSLSYSYRYANDNTGAVKLFMPSSIRVAARSNETFDVVMKIDPKKLPTWMLDGGPNGGNGALLQSAEFDGYVTIRDSRDNIHLAWHVLPHKSADVHALTQKVTVPSADVGVLALQNFGAARAGAVDVFALTGTSPRIPRRQLPEDGDDYTVTDLSAVGTRLLAPDILQFAISTYGRRAHPLIPGGIGVVIDADRDGEPEFELFNADPFGGSNTGETITLIVDTRTGALSAYFYADADLDSGNMILTVPLAAVGLTASTKFSFDVFAYDNYFSLFVSDSIDGMVFTPDTPKFVTSDQWLDGVPPRGSALITVDDVPGGESASPSQSGLLLMYRDAAVESETIQVVSKPRKK
jgi:hypothetical protein